MTKIWHRSELDGGRSDWGTPLEFYAETDKKWGPFDIDLAAHWYNKKHENYFGPNREQTDKILSFRREHWQKYGDDEAPKRMKELVEKTRAYIQECGCDGLLKNWHEHGKKGFINPEYGRGIVEPWIRKAKEEASKGFQTTFLLPARTGNPWFHRYIWDGRLNRPRGGVCLELVEGRLRFLQLDGTTLNGAGFDSMVVTFLGGQE